MPSSRLPEALRALVLTGFLGLAFLAPLGVTLAQSAPSPGEPVIVITPPWENALALAARQGGRLVAPGRVEAIALVWSDDPGFPAALYAAGAWFVLGSDLSQLLCQV
ncbi:MAG: hypothetical protein AAF568_03260 [Pseudomonadota bacterium]